MLNLPMQGFVGRAGHAVVLLLALGRCAVAQQPPADIKRVAAVVTEYRTNAHADVIVSRLLQTQTLDGKGRRPGLKLASLFTDQVPANDISRALSREFQFPIFENVADALTLKTGQLAVDGVLLVAEHGRYPVSKTGQIEYPKRRLFEQVVRVFRDSRRVAPVFIDKHLADNWQDAEWVYNTARELHVPLMAGSSLPVLWRDPPVDVRRNDRLKQITAVSYGPLDAYGFHALEMVQCLAERRAGGETGVLAVQCLVNQAVWTAGDEGVYDRELLDAALRRIPPVTRADLPAQAREPVLWVIDYTDGLRANLLTLNGAVSQWAVAWRSADDAVASTRFATQEKRPFMHFAGLVEGIDQMMHSGHPTWPVERTLLTSGVLDALLQSKLQGGRRLDTPWLRVAYQSEWNWKQPPPPPAD